MLEIHTRSAFLGQSMRRALAFVLLWGCQPDGDGSAAPVDSTSAAIVVASAAVSTPAPAQPASGASGRFVDRDAALAGLPAEARERATVIVLGEFYRERGAHVGGVWYVQEGVRVLRVHRGTVLSERIGVRSGVLPALERGEVMLLALAPSARSLALLGQREAFFTHLNGLEPDEILAVQR
jgi:hypothetical protein